MLEPKVSARMVESLHLSASDQVLEIGTGSGYLTALIARIAGHVTSIEINRELMEQAERNLAMAGITNVTLVNGDGHNGWNQGSMFDAILISGSMAQISTEFTDSLSAGGRLVGIDIGVFRNVGGIPLVLRGVTRVLRGVAGGIIV